jgi:glycogen debranching enzyme
VTRARVFSSRCWSTCGPPAWVNVSEIADAEAPFTPRGCPFQAWSLGELIRLDQVVLAGAAAPPPREKMEPAWA